jgi:hypothetical protein
MDLSGGVADSTPDSRPSSDLTGTVEQMKAIFEKRMAQQTARAHRAEERARLAEANQARQTGVLERIAENTSPKSASAVDSFTPEERRQILKNAFLQPRDETEQKAVQAAQQLLPKVWEQELDARQKATEDRILGQVNSREQARAVNGSVNAKIMAEFGSEATDPSSELMRTAAQVYARMNQQYSQNGVPAAKLFPELGLFAFREAKQQLIAKGGDFWKHVRDLEEANRYSRGNTGMEGRGSGVPTSGSPDSVEAAIKRGDADAALHAIAARNAGAWGLAPTRG